LVLRCFPSESRDWNEQTEKGREFQVVGSVIWNEQEPKEINARNMQTGERG